MRSIVVTSSGNSPATPRIPSVPKSSPISCPPAQENCTRAPGCLLARNVLAAGLAGCAPRGWEPLEPLAVPESVHVQPAPHADAEFSLASLAEPRSPKGPLDSRPLCSVLRQMCYVFPKCHEHTLDFSARKIAAG